MKNLLKLGCLFYYINRCVQFVWCILICVYCISCTNRCYTVHLLNHGKCLHSSARVNYSFLDVFLLQQNNRIIQKDLNVIKRIQDIWYRRLYVQLSTHMWRISKHHIMSLYRIQRYRENLCPNELLTQDSRILMIHLLHPYTYLSCNHLYNNSDGIISSVC